MFTASDMMNTQVISTAPSVSIADVIKILAENRISGLPVVNPQNKVVGVITEKDILEYCNKLQVIPLVGFSGWISPHANISDMALFKKGFEMLDETKVENIMSKKAVTIKKNTPWNEIAALMKTNEINRIPVLDENESLCGIITRADVVSYLATKSLKDIYISEDVGCINLDEDGFING